jgi:hypothetical protein
VNRYNVTVTFKNKNQSMFPGVRAKTPEQAITQVRDELESRSNKFPIKKIIAARIKQWM